MGEIGSGENDCHLSSSLDAVKIHWPAFEGKFYFSNRWKQFPTSHLQSSVRIRSETGLRRRGKWSPAGQIECYGLRPLHWFWWWISIYLLIVDIKLSKPTPLHWCDDVHPYFMFIFHIRHPRDVRLWCWIQFNPFGTNQSQFVMIFAYQLLFVAVDVVWIDFANGFHHLHAINSILSP